MSRKTKIGKSHSESVGDLQEGEEIAVNSDGIAVCNVQGACGILGQKEMRALCRAASFANAVDTQSKSYGAQGRITGTPKLTYIQTPLRHQLRNPRKDLASGTISH